MHGLYWLLIIFPLYTLLAFWTNQLALENPTHHDVVYFYSEYADEAILVLMAVYFFFTIVSRPNYNLLSKRIALCLVIKGIAQFMTIVPQPGGVEDCRDVTFWDFSNCADMTVSGHTAITYLALYKIKYRNFLTFAMAWQLVFANWHYMSDCFIAIIVGYAIEKCLPDESYI